MNHTPRLVAAILGAVLVLAGLTACTSSPAQQPDQLAAQTFLYALGHRDVATAAAATSNAAAATGTIKASLDGMGEQARPSFAITSVSDRQAAAATVHYTASWAINGAGQPWTYDATLAVIKPDQSWTVQWSPAAVYPKLADGQHLTLTRSQPPRAPLLDADGQPLFTEQPVIDVSIDPARVTDVSALAATLGAALKIPAATIAATVAATPNGQAAPVTTLSQATYDQVKPTIYDLPGTQFAKRTAVRGPSDTFGQPLLGQVGQPTKEIIDQSKGAIAAGDLTGTSGLQRAMNTQLAGTPGLSVQAEGDANGTAGPTFAELNKPTPGAPVTLTLNRADQTAAEAALASVSKPASIVLTQPSTGKVLAVANSAAANSDIALTGQYPPGSTFKIVTYTAAFTADPALSPQSRADCPGSINVDGQTVTNENSFVKGQIPLSAAFAFSCNTTAAELGLKLPSGALLKAAQSLGLGEKWSLPVDAFAGSLPDPTTPNATAAASFGQGQVLVSPLLMAEIAGAA
ncbi:MAG: penicillin-binding transpeptidase domain-containing protein, partial [Mycobacteriaceae bacterium]